MAVRLGFCVTGAATTRYAGAGTREWRNGSRAGFRFLCLMTCGFESHLAHPTHPFLQHPIRRRRVQPRRKAVGRALRFRRSHLRVRMPLGLLRFRPRFRLRPTPGNRRRRPPTFQSTPQTGRLQPSDRTSHGNRRRRPWRTSRAAVRSRPSARAAPCRDARSRSSRRRSSRRWSAADRRRSRAPVGRRARRSGRSRIRGRRAARE